LADLKHILALLTEMNHIIAFPTHAMSLGGNAVADRVLTELLPSYLLKLTPSQNDELKSGAKVLGGLPLLVTGIDEAF
jgi:hypothetical protein